MGKRKHRVGCWLVCGVCGERRKKRLNEERRVKSEAREREGEERGVVGEARSAEMTSAAAGQWSS